MYQMDGNNPIGFQMNFTFVYGSSGAVNEFPSFFESTTINYA